MQHSIDITIITVFLLANLLLGFIASKKNSDIHHFSVGNRAFRSFVIFATLSATFIGGGYTLGNAAKVYSMGLLYAFALLGFSLKEILVALCIAPKMDNHNDCISIGDIMAKRYGHVGKVITGVFAMLICAGILGAQVGAMGAIFNTFFGIATHWGILIGFGVIITYATIGGMRAVVYTDIFQFIILVIGIPATFFIGLHYVGGLKTLINNVPHQHVYFLQNKQDLVFFASLFVTFIFGETLVPPYVQRLFMSKKSKYTRNGTLASGLLSIPFFIIVGAIGLIAFQLNPEIDQNNALPYVVKFTLPGAIRGFVVAGIISVIMSSAAGFLNAAAISFVNDIVQPLSKKNLSGRALMVLAQLSTLLVGIGSVFFALAISNVMDILLYAYNFWSPVILVPFVASIFGIRANLQDFLLGAIAGIFSMLIWSVGLNEPFHINGLLVGILGNLIVFTASYYSRGQLQAGVLEKDLVEVRIDE